MSSSVNTKMKMSQASLLNTWLDDNSNEYKSILEFVNSQKVLSSIEKSEKGPLINSGSFFKNAYKKIESRAKKYARDKSI